MATCKGCGKQIEFGVTPSGGRMPLDPDVPAGQRHGRYVVVDGPDGLVCRPLRPEDPYIPGEADRLMVSHFTTCKDANRFSGRNRR